MGSTHPPPTSTSSNKTKSPIAVLTEVDYLPLWTFTLQTFSVTLCVCSWNKIIFSCLCCKNRGKEETCMYRHSRMTGAAWETIFLFVILVSPQAVRNKNGEQAGQYKLCFLNIIQCPSILQCTLSAVTLPAMEQHPPFMSAWSDQGVFAVSAGLVVKRLIQMYATVFRVFLFAIDNESVFGFVFHFPALTSPPREVLLNYN